MNFGTISVGQMVISRTGEDTDLISHRACIQVEPQMKTSLHISYF
jgi:hypothetical protein